VSDLNEKIRYSLDTPGGNPVYCGRRTAAHLDYTRSRLPSGCELFIIQGAFNTGVEASKGTHDYDAVLDVGIFGMDWWDAQRFMRECKWAAWYRFPPTFDGDHLHVVSLGTTAKVGEYVPGQIDDYYHGRNGLAGHAADTTWRPSRITVFEYNSFLKEDEMQEADFDRINKMLEPIKSDLERLRKALSEFRQNQRARDKKAIARDKDSAAQLTAIAGAVDGLPDGASKTEIRKMIKNLESSLAKDG
jgi:hypothetical protein